MKNLLFACGFFALIAAAVAGCMGFEHTSSIDEPFERGRERAHGHVGIRDRGALGLVVHGFQVDGHRADVDDRQGIVQRDVPEQPGGGGHRRGVTERVDDCLERGGNCDGTERPLACAITLTGTAELGTDSIRVPYSGDTCLGNVSGVEILKKR